MDKSKVENDLTLFEMKHDSIKKNRADHFNEKVGLLQEKN